MPQANEDGFLDKHAPTLAEQVNEATREGIARAKETANVTEPGRAATNEQVADAMIQRAKTPVPSAASGQADPGDETKNPEKERPQHELPCVFCGRPQLLPASMGAYAAICRGCFDRMPREAVEGVFKTGGRAGAHLNAVRSAYSDTLNKQAALIDSMGRRIDEQQAVISGQLTQQNNDRIAVVKSAQLAEKAKRQCRRYRNWALAMTALCAALGWIAIWRS